MRSNDQNFSDSAKKSGPPPLYTPEQRARRDSTRWTLVQGILAPIQFVIFLVSLVLVLRYLDTGTGAFAANVSVVVKTCALYLIMVTGAIWEKVVFGKYLFVPAFFWEDVFSMLVLALHTAYLVMLFGDLGTERERLLLALAAYVTYGINAGQFILKLRAARLQSNAEAQTTPGTTTPRTTAPRTAAAVAETPSAAPAMAASA